MSWSKRDNDVFQKLLSDDPENWPGSFRNTTSEEGSFEDHPLPADIDAKVWSNCVQVLQKEIRIRKRERLVYSVAALFWLSFWISMLLLSDRDARYVVESGTRVYLETAQGIGYRLDSGTVVERKSEDGMLVLHLHEGGVMIHSHRHDSMVWETERFRYRLLGTVGYLRVGVFGEELAVLEGTFQVESPGMTRRVHEGFLFRAMEDGEFREPVKIPEQRLASLHFSAELLDSLLKKPKGFKQFGFVNQITLENGKTVEGFLYSDSQDRLLLQQKDGSIRELENSEIWSIHPY